MCDNPADVSSLSNSTNDEPSVSGYVSPSQILPFPKAIPRKSKGNRRRGKTMIATSIPEKDRIESVHRDGSQKETVTGKTNGEAT